MQLHFIRHTTPNIETGVCYGQADIDVTDRFNSESIHILNTLKQHKSAANYDHIYSSPAQRCTKLATVIQQHQKSSIPISLEPDLHEVNFGDWELKRWDDIPRNESKTWMADFVHTSPPNGESLIELEQRVSRFLNTVLNLQHESIAICTHAGVMRLIAAKYLEIPLTSVFNLELNYGQILFLNQHENSFSLRFAN